MTPQVNRSGTVREISMTARQSGRRLGLMDAVCNINHELPRCPTTRTKEKAVSAVTSRVMGIMIVNHRRNIFHLLLDKHTRD